MSGSAARKAQQLRVIVYQHRIQSGQRTPQIMSGDTWSVPTKLPVRALGLGLPLPLRTGRSGARVLSLSRRPAGHDNRRERPLIARCNSGCLWKSTLFGSQGSHSSQEGNVGTTRAKLGDWSFPREMTSPATTSPQPPATAQVTMSPHAHANMPRS